MQKSQVFYVKMTFQLSYIEMKPMKPQTSFKQENRKCLRRPVYVMKPQFTRELVIEYQRIGNKVSNSMR